MNLAALLLLVCASRHYGWALADIASRGAVSKALGAAAALVLLWLVVRAYRHPLVLPVAVWWAWEEFQTLLCSIAYAMEPWTVPPGHSICSAGVGFDLGAFGLTVMAVLAFKLSTITVSKTLASPENDG